jgi:hypothetical protein
LRRNVDSPPLADPWPPLLPDPPLQSLPARRAKMPGDAPAASQATSSRPRLNTAIAAGERNPGGAEHRQRSQSRPRPTAGIAQKMRLSKQRLRRHTEDDTDRTCPVSTTVIRRTAARKAACQQTGRVCRACGPARYGMGIDRDAISEMVAHSPTVSLFIDEPRLSLSVMTMSPATLMTRICEYGSCWCWRVPWHLRPSGR